MNTFLMITHVQRSQMHGEINQKRNGELMFERKLVLEGEMNVTYYSYINSNFKNCISYYFNFNKIVTRPMEVLCIGFISTMSVLIA